MKKFVFKLAALLMLRKREEERIMLLLAEKNREVIARQQELDAACTELKELQANEKVRRGGQGTVVALRYSVAYRYKLKDDILAIGRDIQQLKLEEQGIRQQLTVATQAKKALELVRDQKFAAWKKLQKRDDQNFIDDMAQQRYIANGR